MRKHQGAWLGISGIFIFIGIIIIVVTGIIMVNNGDTFGYNIFEKFESEANTMGMTNKKEDLENANVKKIILTGNYGKVEFLKGDRFSYEIIGNEVDSSMFTHEVENDTWRINIKNRSGFYFFGFGKDDHISKLRITVPSTEVLDSISVKINAGTIEVERLAAKDLKMEMGAGSLDADEIIGENSLYLSVSAGKCKVKNMIGANPRLRCEAGQIDAGGALTGTGMVNCGVGQINLELVGDVKNYDYSVACSVGAIRVNGDQVGGIATKHSKSTNAENYFDLDCGVGQINLKFIP